MGDDYDDGDGGMMPRGWKGGDARAGDGDDGNGGGEGVVPLRGTNESPRPPATSAATAANPGTTKTALLCQETGVHYPTSASMKLLPLYDDGLLRGGHGVGEDGMMIGETLLMGSLVEVDHGEVSGKKFARG